MDIEFEFLVNLALDQKVSWAKLKLFLDDMTPTYEKSKKLNNVLLTSLESLHSKTKKNYAPEMSDGKDAGEQEITEKEDNECIIKENEFIETTCSYEEEQKLDQSFAEQDFSNDSDFHKTDESSIEENAEDYPKDEFVVENNDLNSEGFEEATSITFYKSTDPKTEVNFDRNEVGANLLDNAEKIIENKLYSEIIDLYDKVENEDIINGSPKVNKKQEVIVSGNKKYSCKTCGQLFSKSDYLSKHERLHTGEKPYQCNHCQKSFADSSNLKRHERIHTEERPYQCEVCSKAFKDSCALLKHKKSHTGGIIHKSVVCKTCNRAFSHSGNFTVPDLFSEGSK